MLESIQCIACKTGNGFGDDHIDLPIHTIPDQSIELIPFRGLCAGYACVCIYSGSLPFGIRVNQFGVMLNLRLMRDSWRAGVSKTDKTELVTNGIYQISRNPAFLGFDLLYIGTLLMFFNWILCFLTVFAVIMYHLQIVNVEEDFLFATFGNEYLQYKKKVCRYIGRKR